MSERRIWVVWGGIFTDTTWTTLEPGTEELYGPFHDEAAADRIWREEMRRKVDNATHRLFVMVATQAGAKPG